MSEGSPPELSLLLSGDASSPEEAWADFVQEYSRLLLHVARSSGGGHDLVMDRYTHMLEQLRRDDFHRLRAYQADGRSRFTTWLVVVGRRLCLDHHRQRYGRVGPASEPTERAARRDLADLVADSLDPELLAAGATGPEDDIRALELKGALREALDALDPAARLLLRLRFDDGLPARRIAAIMRLPTAFHVHRRLNQVLERLRTMLQQAGIEDAVP